MNLGPTMSRLRRSSQLEYVFHARAAERTDVTCDEIAGKIIQAKKCQINVVGVTDMCHARGCGGSYRGYEDATKAWLIT